MKALWVYTISKSALMKFALHEERKSVPEDRNDPVSGLRLRDGKPDDAEELFALIRAAFGERLLQYSIYQANESVAYLRVQLDKEILRIAECEGVPVGYYHAVKTESTLFVKYLAAIHRRHCGIVAPTLVRDAIKSGCLMQCSAIECEVPAWNKRLIALYHRYDTNPISASYIYRVDLARVPRVPGLSISPLELEASLTQEMKQGFSKVTARWKSSEIVIGVLNGGACKILDDGGLPVMEIASMIAGYFPNRTHLIAISPQRPEENIPLADIDEFVRMRRPERELRN
jgi:hypothetical protein